MIYDEEQHWELARRMERDAEREPCARTGTNDRRAAVTNDNEPKLSIVRTPPSIQLRAGRDVEIPARRDMVDEVELAAQLGVSRSTLQSWRYSGRGPRYIKIGRLVRYRNVDVDAFLAACTSNHAA